MVRMFVKINGYNLSIFTPINQTFWPISGRSYNDRNYGCLYKSQNGCPRQIFLDGLLSIRMSKISYQALSINLLGICIVCAAKLIATVNFAALRIWTGDGVRKQHSTDHSRHNHNKNWQDFQETSQDRSSFCMGVILSTKGSLDNNLNCMNSIRD